MGTYYRYIIKAEQYRLRQFWLSVLTYNKNKREAVGFISRPASLLFILFKH